MREIKFRAKIIKEKDKGEWFYWNLKSSVGNLNGFIDWNTLGQYTGLKDKNGVEIYEGDIVKNNGYGGDGSTGQIMFGKHNADNSGGEYDSSIVYGYYIKTISNKGKDFPWEDGEINNNEIEVIGNIYENKDLLK